MHLDHVALATRDVSAPLETLVGSLGGTLIGGGNWFGFRSMQVFLGDGAGGMKVEFLEPWAVDRNDFLDRFLTRHGDGAHHLTFKVGDLPGFLDGVAARGLTPVSVELSDPVWREAFLLPHDAHGTVVQLADSNLPIGLPPEEYAAAREHGPIGEPKWWPDPPPQAPEVVRLRRVVLRTTDLAGAQELYAELLGGRVIGDESPDSVELEWDGGARLRLESAPDASSGIDRLELDGPQALELDVLGLRFAVGAANA